MAIFDNLLLSVLLGLTYTLHNLFWLGLLNGAFLLAFDAEDKTKTRMFFTITGIISIIPISAYFAIPWLASGTDISITPSKFFAMLWLGCAGFSWLAAMWWMRYGVRKFEILTHKVTAKTSLERNKKTDVRDIKKHIPEHALTFDPLKFVNKTKGIFLGLDENKAPSYIEWPADKPAPHVQVIGTTGAGKGVVLGVIASQFLERGEAVFFCDPKNDEWAPSVMFDAAKRMGKPYHYINLNRPNGAQFNLFEGATEDEAFELFQAGFGLTEKGDASDFYGIADRREAGITAKVMATEGLTIAEVYAARQDVANDPDSGAEKFFGKLREMAETPSINAKSGGISLAQVIAEGGCVYIVGSMRNDIVKTAQRILLVRLIQLAERRDRMGEEVRRICVILDEVKYHLSRPALEGLSAARDKGVHLVIVHQSLGDLKDCSKDLNPDAVVDAVVENCRVKIGYRLQSPVTAEWFAGMSGTIQVDDESRNVKKNLAQAETIEAGRSIRQADRFLVDENMLLNLPPSVAVLYGCGLAKFVSIQPLKVTKSLDAVRIIECAGGAVKSTAAKLVDLPSLD